jgi:hypothetical protein
VFHSHAWNKKVFHCHEWNKNVFHSHVWTFIQIFEYLFYVIKIQKKSKKNLNWVEITENHVLGLICTQKGQQITKLDF